MTLYTYCCYKCGITIEQMKPMGTATDTIKCDKCKGSADRVYGINISVPKPTHPSRKGRGKG